jgi:DNA-binding transcriptional LysR family regulator
MSARKAQNSGYIYRKIGCIVAFNKTTLEQWAVLAAVVDEGGFAQAAEALHRSQSAVSYSVARLQESLGVALLELTGRRSVLTAHGRTLLVRARSLIHDLDTLELLARSLEQGWEPELKLVVDAAFPRSALFDIVAKLQSACPSTQIQLADAVLSGAEEAITGGYADVVVTSRIPPGFLGDRLCEVEFIAVARADHAFFRLDRAVTADDLIRHVQAVVRDSGTTHRRDDGWLGAEHRFTVSSLESSLGLVLAGLAYAWLPEHLLSILLQEGTLKRIPVASGSSRSVPLHIVLVQPELAGPAATAALSEFKRAATMLQ